MSDRAKYLEDTKHAIGKRIDHVNKDLGEIRAIVDSNEPLGIDALVDKQGETVDRIKKIFEDTIDHSRVLKDAREHDKDK